MHQQYNDVNNQQDATTFSFINLFKSAQHISGDKFAHPQEHFLTLYTAFGTMHRLCCRPVPRLRWNWLTESVPTQPWHRSAAEAVLCTESCIYSQRVLLRIGEFVARNMLGWFKRIDKWKDCCILLSCLHRYPANIFASATPNINNLTAFVFNYTALGHQISMYFGCFWQAK